MTAHRSWIEINSLCKGAERALGYGASAQCNVWVHQICYAAALFVHFKLGIWKTSCFPQLDFKDHVCSVSIYNRECQKFKWQVEQHKYESKAKNLPFTLAKVFIIHFHNLAKL